MRDETTMVAKFLKKQGLDAEPLSSDLSQADRERVMGRMKAKDLRFLCATDVAARGIDISNLSHVINFSVPESPEVYVHRTGRTGRAGKKGTALSLVGPRELGNFRFIRLQFGIKPEERVLPKDDIFEGKLKVPLPPIGTPQPPDPVQILIRGVPQTASDLEAQIFEKLLETANGKRVLAQLVAEKLNSLSTRTSGPRPRPERSDRPRDEGDGERSFDRGDRPDRGDRDRGSRFDRDRGPRGDRPERGERDEGRRFDRDRPRFDRGPGPTPEGEPQTAAPGVEGGERPPRDERGEGRRFDRDRGDRGGDRGGRSDRDRPRFDRDRGGGGGGGGERRFDRERGDRRDRNENRNENRNDTIPVVDTTATEVTPELAIAPAVAAADAAPVENREHRGDRDRGGRDRDRGGRDRDRGGRDRDRGGRDRDRGERGGTRRSRGRAGSHRSGRARSGRARGGGRAGDRPRPRRDQGR